MLYLLGPPPILSAAVSLWLPEMFDLITDAHLKPSSPISAMCSHCLSLPLQPWAEVLEDTVVGVCLLVKFDALGSCARGLHPFWKVTAVRR